MGIAIHIIGSHPRADRLRNLASKENFAVGTFNALDVDVSGFVVWIGHESPDIKAHVWCRPHSSKNASEVAQTIKEDHANSGVEILVIENVITAPHMPRLHVSFGNDKILRSFHNDRDLDIFLLEQAARMDPSNA